MKIVVLLLTLAIAIILAGCDMRSRPRIPELKDELGKALKLVSVSSGAGVGGTRGSDKIQSDQEDCLWAIPKGSDSDTCFKQLKDSIIKMLGDKGAEVVSSGSGASHGYVKEYLYQGGNISSHTVVYALDGGLGFIDVFTANYIAEEEAGKIGVNHIFIPYP